MYAAPAIPPGIVTLSDYEEAARNRMDPRAWAWLAGGSADEITLRANRTAFDRLRLQGRVLADLAGAETRLTLFGQALEYPILLAPVASHGLAHPDGEKATAFGAAAMGATMVVSTQSSLTLEEIAASTTAPLWFQLYVQHDRAFTESLLRRAEAAGCRAVIVTVDAQVSARNREQRVGFALPPGLEAANLRGLPPMPPSRAGLAESDVFRGLLDGAPSWKDIAWLRSLTRLPLLLKGIMSAQDARRAVAEGVDGIVVSNHGGRSLDTLPASIEALPRITGAVAGQVPLLLDGGIRRGTDVLKALALGASAVLVGRPCLHGLAVGGPVGVAHVLKILRTELEIAMALTGCARLDQVDRGVLWEEAHQ
jgi:4-hydroxymandelate oxidase